jgi:hypothetical protein
MNLVLTILIWILGGYVAYQSSRRINQLNPGSHKFGWRLMYLVFAGFGLYVIWYSLEKNPSEELLYILFGGLLGEALNIALTYRQWLENSVPKIAEKS